MKSEIKLEITIPNQTRYLGLIGRIGEDVAREIDSRDDSAGGKLADQINTALTEALVNAIKHADTADPNGEVLIRITVSDRELAIRVFDGGKGFDLSKVPPPRFGRDILEEKGRGLFIIRSMMDSVVYKKANGGNVLEMRKSLH